MTSQGCADKGLCYPPMEHAFQVGGSALDGLLGKAARSEAPTARAPGADAPAASAGARLDGGDDGDRIAGALASRNLPLIAALFFGLGLLLTFTPCVLPMVPILSSIVVGEHVTRGRALAVSLAYVLGMAVVYTAVGVAAGLLGEGLSAALQNPWVLGAFAVLMVALALSMFGLYELQLPQRWQTRLTASSNRRQGGQVAGAAAMGAISALIVGPCVTAPLAGALAYIAQTGDAFTGGGALFAMALGMGVPGPGRRRGRQPAAACRTLDGGDQALLRFPAAGCGDLDGESGAAGLAADGGLGRLAAGGGGLSRRFRPAR